MVPIYSAFIAPATYSHSTAFIDNKIFFFGGVYTPKSVYYLDVGKSFDTESPPWTDLTNISPIPYGSAWATAFTGIDPYPLVYLFGGTTFDPITNRDIFSQMTYEFDPKSRTWNQAFLEGIEPSRRKQMHSTQDDYGYIYIFGGMTDASTGSNVTKYFNDMVVMHTISLYYTTNSIANAPLQRFDYSVVISPDGLIIYIGGKEYTGLTVQTVVLNNISTYNTHNDTWSAVAASSESTFENRFGHSSVIRNITNPTGRSLSTSSDLYILNVKTYTWTTSYIFSNISTSSSTVSTPTDQSSVTSINQSTTTSDNKQPVMPLLVLIGLIIGPT
ncbi:6432_t:CDS:2, partial [Acaulospora morrowiae]